MCVLVRGRCWCIFVLGQRHTVTSPNRTAFLFPLRSESRIHWVTGAKTLREVCTHLVSDVGLLGGKPSSK
jgi:hypothetical protein